MAASAGGTKNMKRKEERLIIFTLLLLQIVNLASGFDYTCFPGMQESAGVTIPRGDISVEVGSEPFPIYCHLNPDHAYFKKGLESDRLGLYVASVDGNRRIDSVIVNKTTISAMIHPDRRTTDQVSCKITLDTMEVRGICYQNIFVGDKPLPPEDFKCISENWGNLNCTWKEPPNPVRTSYQLSYLLPGRHGNILDCPRPLSDKGQMARGTGTCYMDHDTEPAFRQPLEVYQFVMRFSNWLGEKEKPFPINSFAVVRPGPANNISLTPTSPHDLTLHLKIPHELDHFPVGLRPEIRYKSEFDPDGHWKEISTSDFNKHAVEWTVNIERALPYANYTVQVRLQSATAHENEARLWSEPAYKSARSLPQIPGQPPKTAKGSFEIVGGLQERTIFVYWQQIPETMKNGPNFRYSVTEVFEEGKIRPLNPVNVTKAYAVFPSLTLRNYSFYITSVNDMGSATQTSNVFVPHFDEIRLLQPRSFTKIAYTETLFEVSWLEPISEQNISSYTIFWCKSDDNRDRPYQCQGYLEWTEVPKHTRTTNITLPTADIYQFAVAANTETFSSGMVWATCTILHNKVVGKLKTVAVDAIEEDALKVRWRLDCSDRVGIVTGYKIHYCPIASDKDTADCIDGKEFSVVTKPDEDHTWLTGLSSWTLYKVGVAVLTRAGESEISDYLVNRTERGRPGSPPDHFEVVPLQRNQVELFWGPPLIPNAPIDFYQVKYGYVDFRDEKQEMEFVVEGTSAKILSLVPYVNYTFAVTACTRLTKPVDSVCGNDWATSVVETAVGKPGKMPSPMVTFQNSTEVKVEWGHSFNKGGPIDRFELNVTHVALGQSRVFEVQGTDNTKSLSLMEIDKDWPPDCSNTSIVNMFNFNVRAISIDSATNEQFPGEWSEVEASPAYCGSLTPWGIIIGVVALLAVAVMVVTCYCLKCFFCFKQETEVWKKVGENHCNLVIANASQIGGDGILTKMEPEQWSNDPLSHVKKPVYQRAGSKESSETLLPRDPKRNVSGRSDSSSSGCGSARSSEMDYSDDVGKEAANLHDLSGENLDDGVPLQSLSQQQLAVADPAYVAFCDPQNPSLTADSPYLQVGPAGWHARRASLPQMETDLPPGYSKLGLAERARGTPEMVPELQNAQQSTGSPGYVAFEEVRSNNPSPPSNKGYITVAQANKQEQRMPVHERPADLGAYSKVGLDPTNSRGYVQPSFLQHKATLIPKSLWFDPSSNSSQVSNMSDSYSQFRAYPTSDDKMSTKSPVYINEQKSSLGQESPSYVKARLPQEFGSINSLKSVDEHKQSSLLMSPKTLQVEAKAPYSKAVTSLLNTKSSMV